MKLKKPFCLWFTGLSGAGKTTLATAIEKRMEEERITVEHLDGDEIREELSKDLGFSVADRRKNNERIIFVSKLLVRNGVPTLVAFISPLEEIRDMAKERIGEVILVYVNASLEACKERDVKGLYEKAMAGEIKQFTGIDSPFEIPENPDITVDTEKQSVDESADVVWKYLQEKGYIG